MQRRHVSRVFDSSLLQLPRRRHRWGRGGRLVPRRWTANTEEDVSGTSVRRGGRRGGQLDSVSTRWRIHTIRGTSHAEAVDVRHNQTPPLR